MRQLPQFLPEPERVQSSYHRDIRRSAAEHLAADVAADAPAAFIRDDGAS